MSPSKTEQYQIKSEMRGYKLKQATEVAEAAKKKAMKEASEPLGLCLFVGLAIMAGIIALPGVGVLVLLA